ncbi:MAG: S-adenosylmethionine decarboxylase [Candidatus Falkowbacteria bacterium]|nr:S-adenosylmethionine decarboxylase [Candidatus Falkowbacteria bacterium]
MKNLAPNIIRQRFLLEGFYQKEIDVQAIKDYFQTITDSLELKMYGEPIIFSPGGQGKEENQGYDAFVPLIDSGISLYVWANAKFFSLIIYTCKNFDETKALETTKEFFAAESIESMSF